LGLLLHLTKSDKKMKERGNWSEFHFSEVTFYKIHTINSAANSAYFPSKWAVLAVLFSW
jgi:hypothetical protein